ncbi:MAG: porin [Pseudomonadota bacterium]
MFLQRALLAPALLLAAVPALAETAAPTLEDLQKQIEALAAEIEAQKKQQPAGGAGLGDRTTLGGYGEAYFKRIDGQRDEFDAYRLVLFVGHQFSDTVRFGSELEIEHAYVKDSDTSCTFTDDGDLVVEDGELVCGKPSTTQGYVALEQLFIEHRYAENHRWSAGQLLVPVGILNETHEPDTFYGVFRAPVEREIVPGTWFETGAMFSGEIAPGLSYDAMVSSGLKGDGGKVVKDMRQRGSKADGSDLAWTARLKYTGIAGMEIGATWQRQTDASQGTLADNLDGDLLETHVAIKQGAFGLRALYAQWEFNEAAMAPANRKRAEQNGWYIEPSWKITPTTGIFVRHSVWDNEAADSADSEWSEQSVGVNWWLHERVAVKADLQFRDDPNPANEDQDGFNLGIGFSF